MAWAAGLFKFFPLVVLIAAVALFLAMLVATEVGRRIGTGQLDGEPKGLNKGTGAAEGAVFTLLGLLLAFSFSGAAGRFEARRFLVTDEANAIGTAWLRLEMLPGDAQPPIRALFRRYVDLRIATFRDTRSLQEVATRTAEAAALQEQIWSSSVAASKRADALPQAAIVVLPSLNAMIDITNTRTEATQNHPPTVVFGLLALLIVLSALLVGYATSVNRDRKVLHTWAFSAILSLTFYVIVDLEFPRLGLIRIDGADQTLIDLRKSMR